MGLDADLFKKSAKVFKRNFPLFLCCLKYFLRQSDGLFSIGL